MRLFWDGAVILFAIWLLCLVVDEVGAWLVRRRNRRDWRSVEERRVDARFAGIRQHEIYDNREEDRRPVPPRHQF